MVARGVTLTTVWSPGVLLRGWDVIGARRAESLAVRERERLASALADLGVDKDSAAASLAAAERAEAGGRLGTGGGCASSSCRHHDH